MAPTSDHQTGGSTAPATDELRIPVVEETVAIEKRRVETGRVRVRTVVEERSELVRDAITREDVEVTRVPVDRAVDVVPAVRTDGDTTIVPLVEEVLVVEKRLVLREEIHIRRRTSVEPVAEPVILRATRAVVEREANGQGAPNPQSEE